MTPETNPELAQVFHVVDNAHKAPCAAAWALKDGDLKSARRLLGDHVISISEVVTRIEALMLADIAVAA